MMEQRQPEDRHANRRHYSRIGVTWPGKIHTGAAPLDCRIANISVGGARLELAQAAGAPRAIVLSIPVLGDFPSEVVWQGGGQIGIRFLDTGQAVESLMDRPTAGDDTDRAAMWSPTGA
jgi:hypothetical protein